MEARVPAAPFPPLAMRLSLLLTLVLAASACTSMTASRGGAMPSAAVAMTDADLLQVFMGSNEAEILASQTVRESGNAAVRDFAQMMITEHTAVNARADALALDPRDNQVSLSMRQMVAGQVRQLSAAAGAERDRMYMEKQVVLHGHTLDMLDHVLIPNARDPQFKALLQQARPAVAEHLRRAQQIHHEMMMR